MTDRRVKRTMLSGSLAKQIYQKLRTAIIRSELAPGSKLVELELAEKTGTSQGTVREALQRLEREGLVERRAHRGTYVTEVPPDEIQEIFAIRALIESFAARRAVRFMNAADLHVLEKMHHEMWLAADRGALNELIEYDLEFHHRICEWSQSRLLLSTWVPLYSSIQRFIFHTHPYYFTDLHALADTHLPLIEAFRAKDGERAASLIQEHVMLIWSMIEASPPPKEMFTRDETE